MSDADPEPASIWERSYIQVDRWFPHGALALCAGLVALTPTPGSTRTATLALAVAAAAWVAVMHTFARPPRTDHPAHSWIYFGGLLAFATLLMLRETVFFVFAITGFLHAAVLRPRWTMFIGTGGASLSILLVTWGGFPKDIGGAVGFVVVFLVQTLIIGFGLYSGEKMFEVDRTRRAMVRDLEATLAENEGLHAQLLEQAREAGMLDERRRMAREIHDTLAQGLTGIVMQLEAAEHNRADETVRQRHLDNAGGLARSSLAEARRSVQALGPGLLERGRLPDALEQVTTDWGTLHAVPVELTVSGPCTSLLLPVEVGLLRVTQEALANVAKHAAATRVEVELTCDGRDVHLRVGDNGVGFAASGPAHTGYGLTSMRQRADELGGRLAVDSRPGCGTTVSVTVQGGHGSAGHTADTDAVPSIAPVGSADV